VATTRRKIRVARVEYQPDLHQPAQPIPLGVILEELRGGTWQFVIFGRQPRNDAPGLQLENTCGPFRNVVTGWSDLMLKNARELMAPTDAKGPLLDQLAQRWNLNVYLRKPETKLVSPAADLAACANQWFEEYINPRPASKKKVKKARKSVVPVSGNRNRRWLSISLQAHA